ncbi:MAG: polyphosphate polymerase domain-containing protein [Candidatus Izemoplasmatales bacterium]
MDLQRTELKFLLTFDEYRKLKTELEMLCSLDPHSDQQEGHYHIQSLYFDDLYDSKVMEKADGIELHTKYRIRTYNNGGIRLEYKTKSGNLTAKQQLWLTNELVDAILSQNYAVLYHHLDDPLVEQMLIRMKLDHLKPSLYIDYDREAYLYPAGDTRITFDKNITVSTYGRGEFKRKVLEPGHLILEVKYNAVLPDRIAKVVFHRNYQVISYSKYYMGWVLTQI